MPTNPTPDSSGLQPPLRTETFEALFECLKVGTIYQSLERLLIYYLDAVDASVLPHLAVQFNVTGYKGWVLADTEAKQRQLLKNAVYLHQIAGTYQAVLLALESVGFGGAAIEENPPLLADGTVTANGTEVASGKRWARFRLSPSSPFPSDKLDLIRSLVSAWKPERSELIFDPTLLLADGSIVADGSHVADGYK